MEEIKVVELNEQEETENIVRTGFACGWGCTSGIVCIGGLLCF